MSSPEDGIAVGGEVEMSSSPSKTMYAVVPAETAFERKTSADLTWVNLNFKVGNKNILTKCWGKVRNITIGMFTSFEANLINVMTNIRHLLEV